jgi:hypothetical protein
MMIRTLAVSVAGLIMLTVSALAAQQSVARGSNLSADVARDGRIAIDLAGDIWIVPAGGGEAKPVTPSLRSVQRPRWSPDAHAITYQALHQGSQAIWVYDLASGESRRISRGASLAIHASFHPDGERIVYASDPTGEGLDLWEVDLPTGLHWRLSDRPGDETDAAWSSDGRDLVYVHRHEDEWSLILRKHGMPEETLVTTNEKIAGPSFRPDGTLITYVRTSSAGSTIDMVILSQPRLIRPYAAGEKFGFAPVSWLDRHRIVYTAGGVIRQRLFNSWTSSTLPFQATLQPQLPAPHAKKFKRRPLPRIDEPDGQLVIHASRLFDGVGDHYRLQHDIVIDGGRIKTVEPHADRFGSIVVDMGDLVVLPGYIDSRANLSSAIDEYGERLGPLLLSTGLTTIVAESPDTGRLNTAWSGKTMPGPRLLSIAEWPQPNVRAVADSSTPGLPRLLQSRQNNLLAQSSPVARRFSEPLDLTAVASSIVLGSFENGLSPGIALHAEFLALKAAGLTPEQTLKAAGVNAAAALQVDPLLGRIAVGAIADLVFVDGDPLSRIDDALNVVAVVRNGRFFSVGGLIDRVQMAQSVEEIDKTGSN